MKITTRRNEIQPITNKSFSISEQLLVYDTNYQRNNKLKRTQKKIFIRAKFIFSNNIYQNYSMIIRSELKIIADALENLFKDKVIRGKNLVGDLGEYYCCDYFKLKINQNPVEKGFDAVDEEGKKVEIKTRRTPEGKSKIIFKSFDFDYCLFVELDNYFLPNKILKISLLDIQNSLDKKGDRLSVSKIKKTKHVLMYAK